MAEYIREVEKIIDNYHKHNSLFSLNRKTALYNALVAFEDSCRLYLITNFSSISDGLESFIRIREELDSLNVLIHWIFTDCSHNDTDVLDIKIMPERYIDTVKLLELHARQYSAISSAYISYSRGKLEANINEEKNTITFLDNPQNRKLIISDMAESMARNQEIASKSMASEKLLQACNKLTASIKFLDGRISYSNDYSIWNPIYNYMQHRWDDTSELPEDWKFDEFSINDFKQFWVTIATLCFIHMIACLRCGKKGADIEEAVLIKSKSEFVQAIEEKSDISESSIVAILKLLTYNNRLKNNDIIYQPFVEIDNDKLALAPHLILSSKPERNLISLIHKIRDRSYFELTNLREGIMQDQFDSVTENMSNILVAKNKCLPSPLPDVDYAIWDKESNTILICEMKWLVEADSTTEVLARVKDLEHGCNQVSSILTYVQTKCLDFCNRVFGIAISENLPEVIGCVVSKKGIRVEDSDIPVISLKTILDLLKSNGTNNTFEAIKEKSYLLSTPKNFKFRLQSITYAGYTFEIPALIKDKSTLFGTYKRIGPKIGRNDPCPCGSGKKYKKCCGR